MRHLRVLLIFILISSCGGGGSGGSPAVPFSLNLASGSISVNEDTTFTGSISASANEIVTLQYALVSTTEQGILTLGADASVTYIPNENYFGQDSFTYTVTAVEKNITKTGTANITINPVNDAPTIGIYSKENYSKNNLIFDASPKFRINASDIDNNNDELTYSAKIGGVNIPITYQVDSSPTPDGNGEITFDLSNLETAGLMRAEIIVSDGIDTASDYLETWFIAKKRIVTIAQDDDKSDGFDACLLYTSDAADD